jgi:hypothetical protein
MISAGVGGWIAACGVSVIGVWACATLGGENNSVNMIAALKK